MKNRIFVFVLLLTFYLASESVCGNSEGTDPRSLTIEEFASIISAQDSIPNDSIFVMDVRTPKEYKAGTVKGAVNMPVQILDRFIPQLLEMQKENPKLNFIIFCRTKNRSCHAADILSKAGLKNLSVALGWQFWNDENMGKLRVKPE